MRTALALPLIVGFAATAHAHSNGACANNVVEACNAAGGSTEALYLCVKNGLKACETHTHGGGGGSPDSASDDKTADPGTEESRMPKIIKDLQLKQRQ